MDITKCGKFFSLGMQNGLFLWTPGFRVFAFCFPVHARAQCPVNVWKTSSLSWTHRNPFCRKQQKPRHMITNLFLSSLCARCWHALTVCRCWLKQFISSDSCNLHNFVMLMILYSLLYVWKNWRLKRSSDSSKPCSLCAAARGLAEAEITLYSGRVFL